MHKVEVDVVQAEALEARVEAGFCLAVVGVPQLRCDEDIFALEAGGEGLLETLADFGLVAVD